MPAKTFSIELKHLAKSLIILFTLFFSHVTSAATVKVIHEITPKVNINKSANVSLRYSSSPRFSQVITDGYSQVVSQLSKDVLPHQASSVFWPAAGLFDLSKTEQLQTKLKQIHILMIQMFLDIFR